MRFTTREKLRLRRLKRRIKIGIRKQLPLKYDDDGLVVLRLAMSSTLERYKHLTMNPKAQGVSMSVSYEGSLDETK
jgi:hypothetical protein